MELRTFTYTPAAAHRAALALWRRTFLPCIVIFVAMAAFSWQRYSNKPLFIRLLRLTTPVSVGVSMGLITFFAFRGAFSSARYTVTPDGLTVTQWRECTIDRTQVKSLEVTPSSLTLRTVRGPEIRIRKELDDYPKLLDILRSWNPPNVIYRDVDLRGLAGAFIFTTSGIAFCYYIYFQR